MKSPRLIQLLIDALFWLAFFFGWLYLLSDQANAGGSRQQAEQQAYTRALEKALAACLSDSTGRPIAIGDKWYLCGIVEIH